MKENFFENIFNHLSEAVFVMNHSGKLVYANNYLLQHSIFTKSEVLSSDNGNLFQAGKTDINIFEMVKEQKQTITAIQTIRSYRGSSKNQICLVTQVPILDGNGEVAWSVGVIHIVDDFLYMLDCARKAKGEVSIPNMYVQKQSPREVDRPIYKSRSMDMLIRNADMIAGSNAAVLILGESGTGKEVIANYIHNSSGRCDKKMVAINCAAFNDNLMESELFGYEKGAFTGAVNTGKTGLIEQADGGTLFLDEVNSLPLALQAKLLRVLETHSVRPLGSKKEISVDFRVISATNANLTDMVLKHEFREDLYYRLNVLPLTIPPLRERREDIPVLVEYFMTQFDIKYERSMIFSSAAMEKLCAHLWPGNVRELRNFVERLMLMTDVSVKEIKDIPDVFFDGYNLSSVRGMESGTQPENDIALPQSVVFRKDVPLKEQVDALERELIAQAVVQYGSLTKAAKALGVAKSTLIRKRKSDR